MLNMEQKIQISYDLDGIDATVCCMRGESEDRCQVLWDEGVAGGGGWGLEAAAHVKAGVYESPGSGEADDRSGRPSCTTVPGASLLARDFSHVCGHHSQWPDLSILSQD